MDGTIFERIRTIIVQVQSETAPIDPAQVEPSSNLSEWPFSIDSIDFVKIIIGIEEEFGIVAEDEDFLASKMNTVEDIVDVVQRRLDETRDTGRDFERLS
jgi:acyl carrier protein